MKSLKPGSNLIKSGILYFVAIVFFLSIGLHPAFAQEKPITNTTDLSEMDWSDDSQEKSGETELSNMDWSDDPKEKTNDSSDLSNMSWQDDDDGTKSSVEEDKAKAVAKELAEEEIAKMESRTHFYGFVLFIGYILGAVLTGYFTRNRKLAVSYPPELLILLHTVWPVEWLFMIFAGKKVR